MKYLFADRARIEKKLKGKMIFLLLDFDGTLAPIVRAPGLAALTHARKSVLRALCRGRRFKVAVISGRMHDDIRRRVGINGIVYAANHGLEIKGPGINFRRTAGKNFRRIIEKILYNITQELRRTPGVLVEDKGYGMALHYRACRSRDLPFVKKIFYNNVLPFAASGRLKIVAGKKVFEARPAIKWDKGKAALKIVSAWKRSAAKNPFAVIYIGDDTTDEDAFRALEKKGVTVVVGKTGGSGAKYYLRDTRETFVLLKKIWRNW